MIRNAENSICETHNMLLNIAEEMRFDRDYDVHEVIAVYKLADKTYRELSRILDKSIPERVTE